MPVSLCSSSFPGFSRYTREKNSERGLLLFNNYSTIFTEPEENNCFSKIAQVIFGATAFSFILLVFSLKTSRNRAAAIWKLN